MALIKNNDGTVGITRRLNDSEIYRNQNEHLYYYNSLRKDSDYEHKAKTVRLGNLPSKGKEVSKNLPANFNSKIQNFIFSPPSDNLWNITIQPSVSQNLGDIDTKHLNLVQLYNNITEVNRKWSDTRAEGWGVSVKKALNTSKQTAHDYLSHFTENELGVFLASKINFTPMSINYDGDCFSELQQFGGFYKNAKTVKSRKQDDTLRINFLISNWDISEILIDPWIAAIAQHGLIADQITLKATIIITEYSASHPKFVSSSETYSGTMEARKQYVFDGCFPISRDETQKNYETDEAGTYKNSVVTFVYDNYNINYLF